MDILYEDNHIIIINKRSGEIVQGDKTGDEPLSEALKRFIKERDAKPGNVFVGVAHRLDRPVSGVVMFAKTSKALARLNAMFAAGDIHKTYWAISRNRPAKDADTLTHYISTVERSNKSFAATAPKPGAKEARLAYRLIASGERYHLLEVRLMTGRKHQIRVQLSAIGCPVKGDLKYGDKRSNPDGSISLHARRLRFIHPVSKKEIDVTAPVPQHDRLWVELEAMAQNEEKQ
ncbi:MAG: RluA family pseudouridine synthase [Muribaculaceae bacterium]|nr:RluA family pseudouridine synthase [Muribaculaceae bacterium]